MNENVKKYLAYLGIALFSSLLTVVLCFGIAPKIFRPNTLQQNFADLPSIKKIEYLSDQVGANSIITARQKAAPSVVYIDTVAIVTATPEIPEEFRDFFPGQELARVQDPIDCGHALSDTRALPPGRFAPDARYEPFAVCAVGVSPLAWRSWSASIDCRCHSL